MSPPIYTNHTNPTIIVQTPNQSESVSSDNLSSPTSDISSSGRIKVYVRVRPLLTTERLAKESNIIRFDASTPSSLVLMDQNTPLDTYHHQNPANITNVNPNTISGSSFNFDHVFPCDSTNRDIYRTVVCPLVEACLNGFNGTLIAYGQTGSGKTTTLSGNDGQISRTLRHFFLRMHRDRYRCTYKIRLSYLQIYMEKIYDLLSDVPVSISQDLPLREHQDLGVFVEGLSEHIVRTEAEVVSLLAKGQKRLVFAETNMNRHSSRSHAICFLAVERHPAIAPLHSRPLGSGVLHTASRHSFASLTPGLVATSSTMNLNSSNNLSSNLSPVHRGRSPINKPDDLVKEPFDDDFGDLPPDSNDLFIVDETIDMVLRARLTLCDLAGSERIKKTNAKGLQLSEAKDINFSLLELGNVIQALAEGRRHVPYRNSTLTRLLQDSLGGNSLSSLIVCISPTCRDLSETKGTLMFGMRAMKVKTHARINIEIDHEKRANELVEQLQLKEAEWYEKERGYKQQLEDLQIKLFNQQSSSSIPSTTVTNTVHRSLVTGTLKSAVANSQSLINDRTSYQSALDALGTVVEGIRDLNKLISELVNQCLALSQATTLVSLTTSFATTNHRRKSSGGNRSPRSTSPVSTTLQRIHDLSVSRGLGDIVAGNFVEIEQKRDLALFDLVGSAVSVAGNSHLDLVLNESNSLTAPTAIQIALSEVRPLTLARFELLGACGRQSPPNTDNFVVPQIGTGLKPPLYHSNSPSQDSGTNAKLWLKQLTTMSKVVAEQVSQSITKSQMIIDAGSHNDENNTSNKVLGMLTSARTSMSVMTTSIQALQALASQSALSFGNSAVDVHKWFMCAHELTIELATIDQIIQQAEYQLDLSDNKYLLCHSCHLPRKDRVTAVANLVQLFVQDHNLTKRQRDDSESGFNFEEQGGHVNDMVGMHTTSLTDETTPLVPAKTRPQTKSTSMTASNTRECGSSNCIVQ